MLAELTGMAGALTLDQICSQGTDMPEVIVTCNKELLCTVAAGTAAAAILLACCKICDSLTSCGYQLHNHAYSNTID